MIAIDDSINNMIRKLQKRGDVSESRITDLESSIQKRVGNSISSQIQTRIYTLEKILENNLKDEVSKKSFNWILPFIIFSCIIVVVFGYANV